jgi:hypothetical protein
MLHLRGKKKFGGTFLPKLPRNRGFFTALQQFSGAPPSECFYGLCSFVKFFTTFPKQSISINVNLTQNPPKT